VPSFLLSGTLCLHSIFRKMCCSLRLQSVVIWKYLMNWSQLEWLRGYPLCGYSRVVEHLSWLYSFQSYVSMQEKLFCARSFSRIPHLTCIIVSVWWLSLHVNLTELRNSQIACKPLFLGVSVRVFTEEISIWIGELSKTCGSYWCGGHHPVHWGPWQENREEGR
jgi:hypothetical protein